MQKQDLTMVIKNHLPSQDMVEDILSELPAKSLVRFMSVCKPWHRLIRDDPAFKALHSRKTAASPARCHYLARKWTCDSSSRTHTRFSMLHNGTPLMVEKPVFNPFSGSKGPDMFKIVGSHDGLVCILVLVDRADVFFRTPSIYLWNPSINKVKPLKRFMYGGNNDVFGFGFSKESKEHRIVRVIDYFSKSRHRQRREVYVYSSGTDSWKEIGMVLSGLIRTELRFIVFQKPTILDGAPHWLACDRNLSSSQATVIISFNFDADRFGYTAIPARAVRTAGAYNYKVLGTLKGSLAFLDSLLDPISGYNEHEVWVLREYGVESSWIKLFSFQNTKMIDLAGFGIDGEVFLTSGRKAEMLVEVSDSGKVIRMMQGTSMMAEMLVPYTESLVLLDHVDSCDGDDSIRKPPRKRGKFSSSN
ncbi:hypothetical protein Tsubulata_029225 [Turnera subulata]|uniref:F-box domain-containing protein n=1 Tax=Turnera subulata TaxID=218843 RepID=A0A9Q0FSH9_9ROSI|nr:hypothetical protein Tsubulata_029225 [Turnera subulata]